MANTPWLWQVFRFMYYLDLVIDACSYPAGKTPEFYRARLEALRRAALNLNANVNPQLALENFLLRL